MAQADSFIALGTIPERTDMGRLTSLKPRIGGLPPRIGLAPPADERERSSRRAEENAWRAWYGLKRWRDLRTAVFVRDLYTCQRSGVLLVGRYPSPDSPVANHKKPHRGNPILFWDIDNIETVSKAVHDSEIQKEEQAMPPGVWD